MDIKNRLFNLPTLKKAELTEIFAKLDALVAEMITLMHTHTGFVQDRLIDHYIEIVTGTARFKSLYQKENNNRKKFMESMKGGFGPADRAFLLQTYPLLHSFYRTIDVTKTPFNRLVYYTIIEEFLKHTENYTKTCARIAKGDYALIKEKEAIEESVKGRDEVLFGVVKQVRALNRRFLKYRNDIVHPYLRYVYSLSSNNSRNEEQTMENFQVGTFGLMRAILLYNAKSSFGNYVKFWIKQSIMDNVYRSFLINIPHCSWTYFNKLEKSRNQTSSIKELSKVTGFSEKHINNVYSRVLTSQVASLDVLLDSNENQSFLAYLPEEKEIGISFKGLSEDERFIISVLFGYHGTIPNLIPTDEIERERNRQQNL